MTKHVVQSPEWGEFKSKYGTTSYVAGGVQYTTHKVPHTNFYYAYCPKVNPQEINFKDLLESLRDNKCFVINFDAPFVEVGSDKEQTARKIFETAGCTKSKKNTFTKYNILLDISKTEDEILANMHSKHRYNIRYATKHGVTVRHGQNEDDFEIFYELLKETSDRQKYLIHPKNYYKQIWNLLRPKKMVHIITAQFNGEALASWMLFTYDGVLYYPYGGSSEKHKNLHASNLVGFEAIKLGRKLDCSLFDMWGACADINDKNDPEWGFTNFKMKFGGRHVEYIDSYDLVLNRGVNTAFNFAYPKVMRVLKALR